MKKGKTIKEDRSRIIADLRATADALEKGEDVVVVCAFAFPGVETENGMLRTIKGGVLGKTGDLLQTAKPIIDTLNKATLIEFGVPEDLAEAMVLGPGTEH